MTTRRPRRGGITRRARRGQSGVTLLEMLVVVALMSVAIVTLATGLQTSQTATADANLRQQMHLAGTSFRTALITHLADAANWVAPMTGVACSPTGMANFTTTMLGRLDADADTAGWDAQWMSDSKLTFHIVSVNYWVGGPAFPNNATTITGTFRGCGTAVPDNGLQEWVLEVRQPSVKTPITASVVVRKPYP